jgi:hypothetical protein
VLIDVSAVDWSASELNHEMRIEQANECTRRWQAKSEHAFDQLKCQWGLNDDHEMQLYVLEVN